MFLYFLSSYIIYSSLKAVQYFAPVFCSTSLVFLIVYVKFHIACSANLRVCLNEFGLANHKRIPWMTSTYITLEVNNKHEYTTNRSKYFAANVSHIKSIAQKRPTENSLGWWWLKLKVNFVKCFTFFPSLFLAQLMFETEGLTPPSTPPQHPVNICNICAWSQR